MTRHILRPNRIDRHQGGGSLYVGLLRCVSAAASLILLVALWPINQTRADEVPVCSMPRDEFVETAFPDNDVTKIHNGKLLKYANPPGLVVIAPEEQLALKEQVESIFDKIISDNLVRPFRSSFVTYRSFAEAQEAIDHLGADNIFVLVAAEPAGSSESKAFRSVLQRILQWPERVENLIARSRVSHGFSSSNRIEVTTGEVISTAVIINPKYEDAQIVSMTYIAYYFGLSPSASSLGQPYFAKFFDGSPEKGISLTNFARHFFNVFADDRAKFGMTRDSFVACN